MNHSLTSRASHLRTFTALILLFSTSAIVILSAGGGATRVYAPVQPKVALSPEETSYVEYVSPRLEELVDQTSAVTVLVQERSRNVVALNSRGVRISELSSEIESFGEQHGVPTRFKQVDISIRDGLALANGAIDNARKALLRFRFDSIPTLIPEFAAGRDKLTSALADFKKLSDDSTNP